MIELIWRLRYRLHHRLRRFRWEITDRIEDKVWKLRLWLVFHLVGSRSFVANVHIVGAVHLEKMTFGAPMIRDLVIFDTEERREIFMEKSK
jgi:hypothetical protein